MKCRSQSGYFQFEEGSFAKNSQNLGKNYLELSILLIFLQTKPQVENLNINYYNLYYTVIGNLTEVGGN